MSMIEHTLTGRQGVRIETRWFRKPLLVLTVEVRRSGFYYSDGPYWSDRHEVDGTYWRDATVEDLAKKVDA